MADPVRLQGRIVIDQLAHGLKVSLLVMPPDGSPEEIAGAYHLPNGKEVRTFLDALLPSPPFRRVTWTVVDNSRQPSR